MIVRTMTQDSESLQEKRRDGLSIELLGRAGYFGNEERGKLRLL